MLCSALRRSYKRLYYVLCGGEKPADRSLSLSLSPPVGRSPQFVSEERRNERKKGRFFYNEEEKRSHSNWGSNNFFSCWKKVNYSESSFHSVLTDTVESPNCGVHSHQSHIKMNPSSFKPLSPGPILGKVKRSPAMYFARVNTLICMWLRTERKKDFYNEVETVQLHLFPCSEKADNCFLHLLLFHPSLWTFLNWSETGATAWNFYSLCVM